MEQSLSAASGTVDKALDLLFALHRRGQPLGVSALGRALDMPKSSVHRLLSSLTRKGMVERDERGRYQPGTALVALGLGVLDRDPVVNAARTVLPGYAERTGETVFLVGARAAELVVLYKHEGTGWLRASPELGAVIPVAPTAVGALYMAHEPERFPPASMAALAGVDGGSQADAATLAARAEAAGVNGWASNLERWQPGLCVVAAPIVVRGVMRGAVALAAAAPRFAALGGETTCAVVIAAADEMATRLGGGWS